MDTIWYMLNNLKSLVGNNSRFHLLFQVAKLILVTPHSNSGIERFYSLVNKNKEQGTERNRLDIEGSLSSIWIDLNPSLLVTIISLMSHYLFPQKKPPDCTTKLIAANQNNTLELCYFIFKTSELFC